jgi:hypothetical protein
LRALPPATEVEARSQPHVSEQPRWEHVPICVLGERGQPTPVCVDSAADHERSRDALIASLETQIAGLDLGTSFGATCLPCDAIAGENETLVRDGHDPGSKPSQKLSFKSGEAYLWIEHDACASCVGVREDYL